MFKICKAICAAALKSFRDSLASAEALAASIPAMPAGGSVCRSATRRLATFRSIKAISRPP